MKWLETDQHNLCMKYFAFNADFSNSSLDPPKSVQLGIKEGYPVKKWLFYRY